MADETPTGTFTDNGADQQLVCDDDVSVISTYDHNYSYHYQVQ